ncbi:TniB family NTP-binding protein [Paraburkholderia kururiensis]|uniref:TniB family NTP-binding protein n=1 Tax=Paraburkholderia kururiensis TaxID=984307 RepID=UPI000F86BB9E|nr:TniB family NTP-binding protein [Paraburkholderia kururiensis]
MTERTLQSGHIDEIRQIEQILIPHRQFQEVVQRLSHVYEFASGGAEPRHTLLVGESGSGKTWIARYMLMLMPPQNQDGISIKPVLLVSTPATPTLKTLAEAILFALGDPLAGYGTADNKRYRALSLIRSCRVEMIIIDELQHFLDHGVRHSMYSVADWLKSFIDDAGVSSLLMGLPRATAILALNEQLRRRFATQLVLTPFSIDTEESEAEFRSVLNELDKMIPTSRRSGFAEVDIARRIYVATNGLIGYLKKLVIGAFDLMRVENRACIDISLLGQAFTREIWQGGPHTLNPFRPGFALRKLDQPGEPFASLSAASRAKSGRNR